MDLPPYLNALTGQIIGAAIEVHRHLGPGLLESSYTRCLHHELRSRHIKFVEERAVPLAYKGLVLDASYRVDLLVEDAVIVELKCVEALASIHEAQLLTYLRLTNCPVGLLINFNVPKLIDGVKRRVNTARSPSPHA
jgi:GxxExxY protein